VSHDQDGQPFGSHRPTVAILPVQAGLYRSRQQAKRGLATRFAKAADLVLAWSERVRQRRQLARFDDHLLRDIGITRADALAEAEKPFWRA
jgi:uncharacterized protein YjiS (DUF1127 family)